MFQPASVKTLLHMRSSSPVRPATALAPRGGFSPARRRPATCALRGGGGDEEAPRPQTAPALTSGAAECLVLHASGQEEMLRRASDGAPQPAGFEPCFAALLGGREDSEGSEGDPLDDEDPSALLDAASREVYQLQHTWLEERRTEIRDLWGQLEQEYGFKLEMPQELCSAGAAAGMAGEGCPADEAASSAAASSSTSRSRGEAEEARPATALLRAAAADLEAARSLRGRMETEAARRRELLEALPCAVSGISPLTFVAAEGAGEDARLVALRQQLRALRAAEAAMEVPHDGPPAAAAEAADCAPAAEGGESALAALDAWLADLRLLHVLGGAAPAVAGGGGSLSSPQAQQTTREEMAAGEAERHSPASVRHQRASPRAAHGTTPWSSELCAGPPGAELEGEVAPWTPTTPPACTAAGSARSSLTPAAGCSGIISAASTATSEDAGHWRQESNDKSLMELQLDDILGELDEFDSIFSSLCRFTHH